MKAQTTTAALVFQYTTNLAGTCWKEIMNEREAEGLSNSSNLIKLLLIFHPPVLSQSLLWNAKCAKS